MSEKKGFSWNPFRRQRIQGEGDTIAEAIEDFEKKAKALGKHVVIDGIQIFDSNGKLIGRFEGEYHPS